MTWECEHCDGTGIRVLGSPVDASNLLLTPGGSKRIELCACVRAELARLSEQRPTERPPPASGALGLFEAVGDLVDEFSKPTKRGP